MPLFPNLAAALHGVAPKVDVEKWAPALDDALALFEITTPREAAACIGQFLVEAGPSFSELSENLNYTTAARLLQISPACSRPPPTPRPTSRTPRSWPTTSTPVGSATATRPPETDGAIWGAA